MPLSLAQGSQKHDALHPQRVDGTVPGVALSVLAHLGLLAALTFAVGWRASPTPTVSAELWSAVPHAAGPKGIQQPPTPVPEPPPPPPAPPPPPPPPAPVPTPPPPPVEVPKPPAPPDIAIEQERKRKLEAKQKAEAEVRREAESKLAEAAKQREKQREKQLALKQQRLEQQEQERQEKAEREKAAREAKVKETADAKRREQDRKQMLARMMGQAGSATGGSGTAVQSSGPSAQYAGRLAALIRSNSVYTGQVDGNPAAVVEVRTGASGSILSRRLVKSSGHADWDDAVLRAIDRTNRLPPDTDGRVPPVLTIEFRPNA